MKKILLNILMLGTLGFIGWYVGKSVGFLAKQQLPITKKVNQTDIVTAVPQSLSNHDQNGVLRDPKENVDVKYVAIANTKPSEYRNLVLKNHLEKKISDLSLVFPNTNIGKSIVRLACFFNFGPASQAPEGKLVALEIDFLKAHPQQSFEVLREGMQKLDPKYYNEREFLIQIAAKLDISNDGKIELLSNELQRPVTEASNSPAFVARATALSTLLRISSDPAIIESTLRQALQVQSNNEFRKFLLITYESENPEEAKKLRNEFGL